MFSLTTPSSDHTCTAPSGKSSHLWGDDKCLQVDEGSGVDEGVAHLGDVDEHQCLERLTARRTHLGREEVNSIFVNECSGEHQRAP